MGIRYKASPGAAAIMAAMNTFSSSASSHTHQPQMDVCIVGNGVIGKAAALGFAQAGLRVCLLGSLDETSAAVEAWDVRVYALNHVARGLLSSIKVWDALDASRVAAVDSMFINGDGPKQANTLAFDAFGAHIGALAWIVEDRNLNQALDAALRFSSNVRVVLGHATHMKRNDAGGTVHLDSGEIISAALVVGADGGQSWVRSQCDIGIDYRSYKQRAVVTNFDCEKPHHGVAYQWFVGSQGVVALLPLPGQRVSLVWSAPDGLSATLMAESASALAERVSVLSDYKLGQLRALEPACVKAFPLMFIRAHATIAPRVALIGDAAHVVHPLAGHGMNLGFADVAELIKTVTNREPHRSCGDERVLARYARARKEDVLLMQLATDGLARLFGTDSEPVRWARNIGLNLIDKLPVLKRRLISHALGKPE